MPFNLHVILLYIILIRCLDSRRYFMEPSFPDFCEKSKKCKPACNCEVYPNCSLLPMDENVRKTILFYHNQIRDIQTGGNPQSSGMTMLQYDMQLEEISKCWAARCDNEYSVCFKTPRFAETSQSVGGLILEGEESPNVFLWLQIMSYWLGQAEVISVKAIHRLPADKRFESLHNFAQLMSDNVLSVGCAWSILTTDNWLTFVCTYGPRGPEEGEAIYNTGYPCSHCPRDYSCDYSKPFERLCKPNLEGPKSPSDKKKEQLRKPFSPQRSDDIPEHRNPPLNQDFNVPLPPDLPTLSDTQIYRISAELPVTPQEYPPTVPPLPSSPNNSPFYPNFQTDASPYSTTPLYIHFDSPSPGPQYLPQPPPLPRNPSSFPEYPYFYQFSPSPQPNQLPPQPLIPPPPKEEIVQDFGYHQQWQPILPPPPDSRLKPQLEPNQHLYPYAPGQNYPGSGITNTEPSIPPPSPVDLSQEYPSIVHNSPVYDEHIQRSLYPEMSTYLKNIRVGMPSSSSIPSPPQIPPQFEIDQIYAQPVPPPSSYFPPQPPPLPRDIPVIPPLPRSPSYPVPPRPIAPPEDSRIYMTVRTENYQPVTDVPSLFPPPEHPEQSSTNEKGRGKKEERIEDRFKQRESNCSVRAGSFVLIFFCIIFGITIP